MPRQPSAPFARIVDGLQFAIVVFRNQRVLYHNLAAQSLRDRLRREHGIELLVMLRDQVTQLQTHGAVVSETTALITPVHGEPLHLHVMPLPSRPAESLFAITVRALGVDRASFHRHYGLSPREAQVAELVLRGFANRDIAAALGITLGTTKRHLTRVFDKVGLDSRTQLVLRLA